MISSSVKIKIMQESTLFCFSQVCNKNMFVLVEFSSKQIEEYPEAWLEFEDGRTFVRYPQDYQMPEHSWIRMRQQAPTPQEDWIKEEVKILTKKGL